MENNMDCKYDMSKAKELFDTFDLKYNMSSIVYLKDKGLSLSELINYDEYNMIPFIAAGIKGKDNKTYDKAIEIIDKFMDEGYTLKMLFLLCYERCKENGFFTSDQEILYMKNIMETAKDDFMRAMVYHTVMGKVEIESREEN